MHFAFLAHEIGSCAGGRNQNKGSPLRRPLADNLLTMTPMRHFVCSCKGILRAKLVVLYRKDLCRDNSRAPCRTFRPYWKLLHSMNMML
jgi:hypothetical protein